MADSDALLVVEDWISEHFFTTDARKESYLARVLDRVKRWRDAEHPTTKSRFTAERSKLATAMAALYADDDPDPDAAAALHADLRRILGYEPGPYDTTVNGPVRLLRSIAGAARCRATGVLRGDARETRYLVRESRSTSVR